MRRLVLVMGILCLMIITIAVTVGCAAPQPTPTPPPPTQAPAVATKAPSAAPQPTAAPPAAPKATAPAAKAPAATPTKVADQPLSPPVVVKAGVTGSVVDAGFYIPYDRGYFKEQGLDVELVNFASGSLMPPPLGTGQLDVGAGGINAGLFNMIAREIPLRIVADKTHAEPGNKALGFLVRKDLLDSGAIKTPADLKGKVVAMGTAASGSENELVTLLAQGGLTIKDIEIKTMGFSDVAVAFANKSVDFAFAFEPNVTTAEEKGGAVMWKPSHDIIPYHEQSIVLYGPAFIEKKFEAAKRFMVAYLKGIRDYNDAMFKNKGKDAIIAMISKYSTQADPAVLRKLYPQPINPDGYIYLQSIQSDVDYFTKAGHIKYPVNLKEAIDNRFVDYAIERLGKYQ
ncbi:MAG: ABC transporter substrate-binding protein [Chloroflexi bacterium]|nr:ABC transporter substrate-binding protein [Chloroflexota bacterium]